MAELRESVSTASKTDSQRNSKNSATSSNANAVSSSEKHESQDGESAMRHRAAALVELESGGLSTSTPERLRRSLFMWSLIRLVANLVLFGLLVCTVLLLVWPAVEGASFPGVSYAGAQNGLTGKQVVTIPVPGSVGSGSAAVTIGASKAESVANLYLPAGVSNLMAQPSTDANDDKITTLVLPLAGGSSVPVSGSPFIRTVYAEFSNAGFPALVLGLAIIYLFGLFGTAFSVFCLARELKVADGWKTGASFDDGNKGVVGRTFRAWKEWVKRVEWRGHRGQCVTAGRVRAMVAVLRAAYVVSVLVVVLAVAGGKVNAGKGVS